MPNPALPRRHTASVLSLHSAIRRRGFAPLEGDTPVSVRVAYKEREATVCLGEDGWYRRTRSAWTFIAPEGHEDDVARRMMCEVLGVV